jgi:hypothetical protein
MIRTFVGMKRTIFAMIALGIGTVAAFVLLGREVPPSPPSGSRNGAHSMWYHESDVTLIGATCRPQLVEFFHLG